MKRQELEMELRRESDSTTGWWTIDFDRYGNAVEIVELDLEDNEKYILNNGIGFRTWAEAHRAYLEA